MSGIVFGSEADGVFDKIRQAGIVPVVTLKNTADALPLAKALFAGGLRCVEVTFRTEAAEDCIKAITSEYPDMLVGAGTVLSAEQAGRARAAGAAFAVSPGFNPSVVRHCIDGGFPIIPGCSCPSDIEMAIEFGLDAVKFFPAEAAGGLKMLKALSAPYSKIGFMPTGGITLDNLISYLSFDKVIAVGGSFMVSDKMIAAGEFDRIARLAGQAERVRLCVRSESGEIIKF